MKMTCYLNSELKPGLPNRSVPRSYRKMNSAGNIMSNRRRPIMEDDLQWKRTSNLRGPPKEDNLQMIEDL